MLKLGLFSINAYACCDPAVAARVARAAEAAGFESLWGGEHVVLPDPQAPPSPLPPEAPILDPAVALTFMAAHTERPIIFPLSNPTHLMEAKASDLIAWTDGRALVATGIPSRPVTYKGMTYVIGQANNALLYPGLGLGTIVSRARKVSDGMFTAAAQAVANQVDTKQPGASLLPHVENLRTVSATVAVEVAKKAANEELARVPLTNVIQQVQDAMWQPVYPQMVIKQEVRL